MNHTSLRLCWGGVQIHITIAAMVVLVVGAGVVAHADEHIIAVPLNVDVEVIEIVREHGIHADLYLFLVEVTNHDDETLFVDASVLTLDSYTYAENDCAYEYWVRVSPGNTVTLHPCYYVFNTDSNPTTISILGHGSSFADGTYGSSVLPFVKDQCEYWTDDNLDVSCEAVQRIDRLIQHVHPESDACEIPATTRANTEASQLISDFLQAIHYLEVEEFFAEYRIDTDLIEDVRELETLLLTTNTETPKLLSVAYHPIFGDLILSFNEDITLLDGWEDNISIAEASHQDHQPLSSNIGAKNRMSGASSIAWISLPYGMLGDLQDVESLSISVAPNTFVDVDGNPNIKQVSMQVELAG